jgi:hypothetical protein
MRDYIMSFNTFNNSVEELFPFLKLKCLNPMNLQLEIRKMIVVVLYRFVHGFSFKHMSNRFDVGAPIVQKYVDILYDVLCDKNKLFGKYINMPFKEQPLGVIHQYQEFTSLPNICNVIDGTHISLIEKLGRRYIPPMLEYYN